MIIFVSEQQITLLSLIPFETDRRSILISNQESFRFIIELLMIYFCQYYTQKVTAIISSSQVIFEQIDPPRKWKFSTTSHSSPISIGAWKSFQLLSLNLWPWQKYEILYSDATSGVMENTINVRVLAYQVLYCNILEDYIDFDNYL